MAAAGVPVSAIEALGRRAGECNRMLEEGTGAGADFLGWVSLPSSVTETELRRVKDAAEKLRAVADVVVVVGIGGSYLGARAVLEALGNPFACLRRERSGPDVVFAGQNISEDYLYDLLEALQGRSVGVIVISKSGTTTEPAIAFRILRGELERRYGKAGARERIVAVTDRSRGALKGLADREGYATFVIPDDVGGRYSVLTPVGLLPLAAAGVDIGALVAGAREMEAATAAGVPFGRNPAEQYAAARNVLYGAGYRVEILGSYEPSLHYVGEWWKQLFGESEGKDGQGVFPASVEFTTDLHSMGQYIQEGARNLFETVVRFTVPQSSCLLDPVPGDHSGLDFLRGKDLRFVNEQARRGTVLAHVAGGVPNLLLTVQERTPYWAGQLVYFFEYACGLSGYLLGVNPFNQPGVEAYKTNMFALLGKPGFAARREDLLSKGPS